MNAQAVMIELARFPMAKKNREQRVSQPAPKSADDFVTWSRFYQFLAVVLLLVGVIGWLYYALFQNSLGALEKTIDIKLTAMNDKIGSIVYPQKAREAGIKNPQIATVKARVAETFRGVYAQATTGKKYRVEVTYKITAIDKEKIIVEPYLRHYLDGELVAQGALAKTGVRLDGGRTVLQAEAGLIDTVEKKFYRASLPAIAIAVLDSQADRLVIATGEPDDSKKS